MADAMEMFFFSCVLSMPVLLRQFAMLVIAAIKFIRFNRMRLKDGANTESSLDAPVRQVSKVNQYRVVYARASYLT